MLMKISHIIIKKLLSQDADLSLIQTCEYGCEIMLYTILSTLGLALIGTLAQAPISTFIIIAIFYVMQSNGGGFHASSHIRCFLTMAIGLLFGLCFMFLHLPLIFYFIIGTFSSITLFIIPLQLNKNKMYLVENSPEYIIRSRHITVCIYIIAIFMYIFSYTEPFISCCIALMLSSISRMYSKIYNSFSLKKRP